MSSCTGIGARGPVEIARAEAHPVHLDPRGRARRRVHDRRCRLEGTRTAMLTSLAGGAGGAELGAGPGAGRAVNKAVIGRVRRPASMSAHDFFMCTRSIVAVAGQV
jgi:hypothetical protein